MIARESPCDIKQLTELLEDRLDLRQQSFVTHHLDQCSFCQQQLQRLTADDKWWSDARETLFDLQSDTTDCGLNLYGGRSAFPASDEPTDRNAQERSGTAPQEHWVLSLLQPTDEASLLGSIDGLLVESVVGQGGMGVVLKARDPSLQRYLAVKLLSPMLAGTGAARQRFFREARAAAAIVHPNIVPIYAVSAERSLPYLIMPLVAGGNLQHRIDQEGALPLERSLSIGLQVADGLAAAHRQGIVHRDIKPANLLLDEGGFRILISDFGLARALDDTTLTGSGLLAGTPQYMSPEQARGAELDHRTDIYSLGAVLYAMATGRPPVRGASTLDILRRIAEESPQSIVKINPDYPDWYQRLVQLLMAPKANDRLQSAEQVAELMRSALAHARAPLQSPLPFALRANHRHWRTWLVLGTLLVLVGPVAYVTSQSWSRVASQNPTQFPHNTDPVATATQPLQTEATKTADEIEVTEEIADITARNPLSTDAIEPWSSDMVEQLLNTCQWDLMQLQMELEGINPVRDIDTSKSPKQTQ